MVPGAVWLLTLLALAAVSARAAPTAIFEEYQSVPPKRAALVLDRLLVALQHALHDDQSRFDRLEEPRTAPLRTAPIYANDMSSLQRRGQAGPGRGRVLRCYFNAITCF